MEKKVTVKMISSYNGHSIKQNGNVDVALKCTYGELVNAVQCVQLLNNDISLAVKLPDEKPFKLGTFRLKELKIDNDGESVVKFNSQVSFVETDNLNRLVTDGEFQVRLESEVDVGEAEEE